MQYFRGKRDIDLAENKKGEKHKNTSIDDIAFKMQKYNNTYKQDLLKDIVIFDSKDNLGEIRFEGGNI